MSVISRISAPGLLGILGASAVLSGGAAAQSMSSDGPAGVGIFARDRSVSVLERQHPEFDAQGLPLGTFRLYPSLGAAINYDDNLFGLPGQKVGDAALELQPALQLRNGSPLHAINIQASARIARYFSKSSENVEDWKAGTEGKWEIAGRTQITAGADWKREHESRLSENIYTFTRKPIAYDTLTGRLGVSRNFGRIRLSALGSVSKTDYADATAADGTLLDQSSRNNTAATARGRADFALNPDTAFFVQTTFDWRDFKATDLTTPRRSSRGYEVLGGASFERPGLLRGEIGVGYLVQNFDNAYYTDISGLGLKAKLEWFVTQLTTITATGTRTVSDSGIPQSGGYLTTRGGLQVDHELLRNVILSANGDYQRDNFNNLDRTDTRIGGGLAGRWQVNPMLSFGMSYRYLNITSAGLDRYRDLSDNRLIVKMAVRR